MAPDGYEPTQGGAPRTPGWTVAVHAPGENPDPLYVWHGEARNTADALRIAYLARRLEQQDEEPGGDYPPANLRDDRPAEPQQPRRPRRQRMGVGPDLGEGAGRATRYRDPR